MLSRRRGSQEGAGRQEVSVARPEARLGVGGDQQGVLACRASRGGRGRALREVGLGASQVEQSITEQTSGPQECWG